MVVGDLPEPVATHFAPSGVADGFSSHGALWAITLGIPAVLAILLGTAATTTARHAPLGLGWINGLPVGIVWFVGTLMIATVVPQRGLADAAGFTLPTLAVPLSVAVGVAVTTLADEGIVVSRVGRGTRVRDDVDRDRLGLDEAIDDLRARACRLGISADELAVMVRDG